jgi:membrane protein implicated in regulation of membrane protease activity
MSTIKKDNWLYPALICIICFIVSLLNRQNPFDMTYMRYDSSIYQYIGWQMTEGKIPYRDIFDHKGPVIYFWNMLGYGLHPMLGQWFLEFCALFVSAILAFKMGCRFISPAICTLIIGIIFFNTPAADTIGNIENLGVMLSYIILNIFIFYISDNKISIKQSFLSGIICSLLLFLKPTYLATPAILFLYIAINMLHQKRYTDFLSFTLYFTWGFLGIALFICCWLHYHNALLDFWHCYIEFNLEYARYWQKANSHEVIRHTLFESIYAQITILLVLYLILTAQNSTTNKRKLVFTLSAAIILNIIGIILPNNLFLHYIYILYPLIFLMSVIALAPWQKQKTTFIILSICFMLSGLYCASNIQKTVSDKNARQAATMINTLLQKDETFQTLGWDMARLHLLSGHAASTPYVLTGMYDRLHQRYLYTFIKNAHPPLVAIVTYPENDFYHKLIKAYWKNFDRDYVLFSNRFGYEIYVLRHKIPKVQPQ